MTHPHHGMGVRHDYAEKHEHGMFHHAMHEYKHHMGGAPMHTMGKSHGDGMVTHGAFTKGKHEGYFGHHPMGMHADGMRGAHAMNTHPMGKHGALHGDGAFGYHGDGMMRHGDGASGHHGDGMGRAHHEHAMAAMGAHMKMHLTHAMAKRHGATSDYEEGDEGGAAGMHGFARHGDGFGKHGMKK